MLNKCLVNVNIMACSHVTLSCYGNSPMQLRITAMVIKVCTSSIIIKTNIYEKHEVLKTSLPIIKKSKEEIKFIIMSSNIIFYKYLAK